MTCSQCGKRFSARACGPTHATVFAWMEAERKRIRRRVGYGLRAARGWAELIIGDADQTAEAKGLAGAFMVIDEATKRAPGAVTPAKVTP